MKRMFVAAALALSAAAILPAQNAQHVDVVDVHATVHPNAVAVPFAFQASQTSLPPGEYEFRQGPLTQTATLINVQTGRQIVVMKQPVTGPAGTMRFTFRRAGDRYYLRQMWQGGAQVGAELPTSKAEREARKSAGAVAAAGN